MGVGVEFAIALVVIVGSLHVVPTFDLGFGLEKERKGGCKSYEEGGR